jgi:hypothetical protein
MEEYIGRVREAETVVSETLKVLAGGDDELGGFRGWVHREKVLPLLEDQMNAFLCEVGGFEVVIALSEKKFTPVFMIRDRGSVVSYMYGGGH